MTKMNLYHPTTLLISTVLFSCTSQLTPEELFTQSRVTIRNIQTLEYTADYKIKFFTEEDTTNLNGMCQFEKIETDTLLGFKTRIRQDRGYEHIYTLDKLYVLNHNDETALIEDPKKDGVGSITGNTVEGLIFDELINGVDLKQLEKDSAIIDLTEEEESETHWVLRIIYPDDGDFTEKVKKIWLNKETLLPNRMTFQARWQDMLQYNEITIKNLKINRKNTARELSAVQLPKKYAIEHNARLSEEYYATLENGITAPNFELTDLNGNTIKLSSLKGQIVLLDFWYMSCYPCVKALPHLEELHKTYSARGLTVLGLNFHDNNNRKERLPEFLSKRDITYPTVLATKSIDSSYNVKAYPTLYLINKEGKVMHSQLGFGDATKDTLEQMILAALQ